MTSQRKGTNIYDSASGNTLLLKIMVANSRGKSMIGRHSPTVVGQFARPNDRCSVGRARTVFLRGRGSRLVGGR